MQINIKSSELDLTDPLKKYIETRMESLSKYLRRFDADLVRAEVEVARTTQHHRHGEVYYAEVNLTLPGKLIRATHEGTDVRECIDKVKDVLKGEIDKYKDQLER
ncbi:MAG: ribosome-associated translation inhibitor RaiA [Candidatus Colwellbacteria bacterium]|nr:ribosome-associated translation inhibitor RaiA [Candidatus Colwellbacteria bacterium]